MRASSGAAADPASPPGRGATSTARRRSVGRRVVTPPSPPRSSLWKRLLAVALGLAFALGGAELAARALGPPELSRRATFYPWRPGSANEGLLRLMPNTTCTYSWDGDPYGTLPPGAHLEVPLNGLGLRGPQPGPGRSAVLFVGDSFTFGEGVSEEDTFVHRIAVALAAAADAAADPEAAVVVNGGVPGYGTQDELRVLPELVRTVRPRAVVLVFTLNDPISLLTSLERDRDFMQDADAQSESGSGSRLLRWARRWAHDRDTVRWYRSFYTGENRDRWEAARDQIREMRDIVHAAGAKFGVVVFPLVHRLDVNPFREEHALVVDACRTMGVPVLDLAPALQGHPDASLWVHPTDHHPNGRAHALAAEAMVPFVEDLLRSSK